MYAEKTTGLSGNLEMELQGVDSNGKPDGTVIASSAVSTLGIPNPGLPAWITFSLSQTVAINTRYAVVLRAPNGIPGSEFVRWFTSADDTYAAGYPLTSLNAGVDWTTLSAFDFSIKVRGWTGAIPLLPPTATFVNQTSENSSHNIDGLNQAMQTFTTGAEIDYITGVAFEGQESNAAFSGDIAIDIYALDGSDNPTGSALGTLMVSNASLTTAIATESADFSTEIPVQRNTKYGLVMREVGDTSVYAYRWRVYVSADLYADGAAYISNDGGMTWTLQVGQDFSFQVRGRKRVENDDDYPAYRAYAQYDATLNFLGCTRQQVAKDAHGEIISGGEIEGFSELVPNQYYYLQDDGSIGLTPGTHSVCVGKAVSVTKLNLDNRATQP